MAESTANDRLKTSNGSFNRTDRYGGELRNDFKSYSYAPHHGIQFAGHLRAGKVCYFARIILSRQTIIAPAERPSEWGECLSISADLLSMAGIQCPAEESGKRKSKFASLVNHAGAI